MLGPYRVRQNARTLGDQDKMSETGLHEQPADVPAGAALASGRAWWTLALLTVAYMLSIVDRQILNLVAPEIQRDLHLTDLQLSYLQGLFFVVLYVAMGPVFGWLADMKARKVVAAAGVAIWSLATAASSLGRSFGGLALARVGIGAGEAAIGPVAASMISDIFPPGSRAKAMALFGIGPILGAVAGLLAAPLLIPRGPVDLGPIGVLQPWQVAFLLAGLPGFVVAAALLMLREPPRKREQGTRFEPGAKAALRYMKENRRAYFGAFGGAILMIAVGTAASYNVPLFFHRTFGWDHYQIGRVIGLLNLATLLPGALFGGWLASYLRRKGRADATYLVMLFGSCLFSIPAIVAWLMPTAAYAVTMLGVQNLGMALISPLMAAVTADLSPSRYRGFIMAMFPVRHADRRARFGADLRRGAHRTCLRLCESALLARYVRRLYHAGRPLDLPLRTARRPRALGAPRAPRKLIRVAAIRRPVPRSSLGF